MAVKYLVFAGLLFATPAFATTYWIDGGGNIIGSTSSPTDALPGAVASTTMAPESGRQKWNGTGWTPAPVVQPEATLGDVWEALKAKFPQLTDADLPPGKSPPRKIAAP